jgi:hypothetical protein
MPGTCSLFRNLLRLLGKHTLNLSYFPASSNCLSTSSSTKKHLLALAAFLLSILRSNGILNGLASSSLFADLIDSQNLSVSAFIRFMDVNTLGSNASTRNPKSDIKGVGSELPAAIPRSWTIIASPEPLAPPHTVIAPCNTSKGFVVGLPELS